MGRSALCALPQWIPPQLTELIDVAPEGDTWLHEIIFDGYRGGGRPLVHGAPRHRYCRLIGSMSVGSLFLMLPTRAFTGQQIISSEG